MYVTHGAVILKNLTQFLTLKSPGFVNLTPFIVVFLKTCFPRRVKPEFWELLILSKVTFPEIHEDFIHHF